MLYGIHVENPLNSEGVDNPEILCQGPQFPEIIDL